MKLNPVVALVFISCAGHQASQTAALSAATACYDLSFDTWRSSDPSPNALAAVGLVSPLPKVVSVTSQMAQRDTMLARLVSTSGWVLRLRLVGSLQERQGEAWLVDHQGPIESGGPLPSTTVNATSVSCSAAAIPLEDARRDAR